MRLKHITLAAGALLLSATAASAAVVTNDLNLRAGPNTGFRVVDTMPQGAYVRVLDCGGSWCRVRFRGRLGYASANYITGEGAYAAASRAYAAPPVIRFGFRIGDRGWRRDHWRDRHHWRGRRDWRRYH